MKTKGEQLAENMKDPAYMSWYMSRPPAVKQLIIEYPYPFYKVKEGAPYGISAPGTVVILNSYRETGEVSVIVPPENLTEIAKAHIMRLTGGKEEKYKEAITVSHLVVVEPQYLDPYEKGN